MKARKNNTRKVTVALLSIILVLCCTIGGTLAWLTDATGTVTNTFTVGDVDIEISETGAVADGTNLKKDSYKIIPGTSESKDPKVTVKTGSEACWVFVKIVENNNYIKDADGNYTAETYIDWSADTGKWTLLSKTPDAGTATVTYVYYIEQAATDADVPYEVLANNKVSYDSGLTKAQLDALGETKPTLTFTAYAIQKTKGDNNSTFTAAEAWAELNKP